MSLADTFRTEVCRQEAPAFVYSYLREDVKIIIHLFIFCHFILLGVTPWTGRQFITGLTNRDEQPSTLAFTPSGNLESPFNLSPAYMFLDWGRKPEYTE